MARPKVHDEPRRTTGLKLRESVSDALRAHNAATGIPMNKTIETLLMEFLAKEGYYQMPSTPQVPSIAPARAVLRKTS